MSDAIVRGMPQVPPPPASLDKETLARIDRERFQPKPRAKTPFRLPSLWSLVALSGCAAMAYSVMRLTWHLGGLRWCVYVAGAYAFGFAALRSLFRVRS